MKAIAAMSLNRVIGCEGKIPWHLPEDFRWFKRATLGQVVLMGRRTFESLGKPLPGRRNLVATRGETPPGTEPVPSLEHFDPAPFAPLTVWVIGGAEVYRALLPRCAELYLSVVRWEVRGDVFFPPFEADFELAGVELSTDDFEVRRYVRTNTSA